MKATIMYPTMRAAMMKILQRVSFVMGDNLRDLGINTNSGEKYVLDYFENTTYLLSQI